MERTLKPRLLFSRSGELGMHESCSSSRVPKHKFTSWMERYSRDRSSMERSIIPRHAIRSFRFRCKRVAFGALMLFFVFRSGFLHFWFVNVSHFSTTFVIYNTSSTYVRIRPLGATLTRLARPRSPCRWFAHRTKRFWSVFEAKVRWDSFRYRFTVIGNRCGLSSLSDAAGFH